MELSIDRDSPLPIHEQMTAQIRLLIDSGELQPGSALPTIKATATRLGLNANTVAGAYRALEEEGYLNQRKRAGTTVAEPPPRRMTGILAERLAAEAAAKATAAGVGTNELVRAVAAQRALAGARPKLRIAVLAETELQATVIAKRTESILGDEAVCLPLTPDRYDSVEFHLTVVDPRLTARLSRPQAPLERPLPTHLEYSPEFPAGAD